MRVDQAHPETACGAGLSVAGEPLEPLEPFAPVRAAGGGMRGSRHTPPSALGLDRRRSAPAAPSAPVVLVPWRADDEYRAGRVVDAGRAHGAEQQARA
ncbi:hypothetical protein BL254_23895 [Protofrankia sp. BMG5.30]|uniref:Uncharacterized protein n=1 Tax=Protofrankia coriariae TaxID=1562887 RepID=A0ABR5EZN2_9ACTN|nr:hypothetical protein FrCorBMG51_21450 [Protofrankia coriariae]ONH30736.1 hypothetical protein BL254_23895 [Protofrankia sp. BMG5.30]